MSNAWDTTTDDVLNVLHNMGKKVSSNQLDTIFEDLDFFAIESAALKGNDLDEQCNLAYDDIKRQLLESNAI
jgi:hypothetical protein